MQCDTALLFLLHKTNSLNLFIKFTNEFQDLIKYIYSYSTIEIILHWSELIINHIQITINIYVPRIRA